MLTTFGHQHWNEGAGVEMPQVHMEEPGTCSYCCTSQFWECEHVFSWRYKTPRNSRSYFSNDWEVSSFKCWISSYSWFSDFEHLWNVLKQKTKEYLYLNYFARQQSHLEIDCSVQMAEAPCAESVMRVLRLQIIRGCVFGGWGMLFCVSKFVRNRMGGYGRKFDVQPSYHIWRYVS